MDAEWKEGGFLDYDQSSVDPRFYHDTMEGERIPFKAKALMFLVLAILGIFGARLFYLQVVNYQEYLALAEGNRLRVQYLLAPRGLIIDSNGKNLVLNQPSYELVVTPLDLPKESSELESVIGGISDFFELDRQELEKDIAETEPGSFHPITLKQDVDKEKAVVFATRAHDFPGFSIQNNPRRDYLDGPIFSHILGYTGKLQPGEYDKLAAKGYLYNDIIGKDGLEVVYEDYLRGTLGENLVEVDVGGAVQKAFQQKDPEAGNSLLLNLDSEMQKVIYDSLLKQLKLHRASRAAAVAIDPRTGGVLALVSLPGYDNNLFSKGISKQAYQDLLINPDYPLFNRAISGTYPPGSTVKPALAAGALQEGVITDKTKIFDGGRLVVPNQFNPSLSQTFRGWNTAGLGEMDVYSAIAQSSDIFFYTVGGGQSTLDIKGLGAEKVAEYLSKFYLGRLTGIDLPAEKTGLIPTPEWKAERYAGDAVAQKWYLGDTYNMSIGQGFDLVTPLQLAVYTASVANGGKIYQPYLVKAITDNSGETLVEFSPKLLEQVEVDPKFMEIIKVGMRQTVTEGTARSLSGLPIAVAGKTGTSQFDSGDLENTHAWFISFAPYEDPKIALAVLVELGGEGSGAAAPVAYDVYKWYSENRQK